VAPLRARDEIIGIVAIFRLLSHRGALTPSDLDLIELVTTLGGVMLAHQRTMKLELANRELESLLGRARELEQLKTKFFANVSHELRTPLSLILGPTEKLLAHSALSASDRRDLDVVVRNARALLTHVNDLLDVSKLEAGKLEPRYSELCLARLLRRSLSCFEILASERHIDLVVDVPPTLHVQADAEKIEHTLVNLVSNAFKFTPAHGTIRCSAFEKGHLARIEIADSGIGVHPDLREVVFERFRQLEGAAPRGFGSTGLGLAIARDFIGLHGGTIQVDDAPEGGARFVIELPLRAPQGTPIGVRQSGLVRAVDAARDALAEERAAPPAVVEAVPPDAALALVVDDNPEMRAFVVEVFAHMRVVEAVDGLEGLEKARALRPDVVITDVMMPRMGGDELVRALRASPETASTPVVLLTAKADDEMRVELLRHGDVDHVMKPFSPAELQVRVANLVALKRTRDLLQRELSSQTSDLETLAGEMTLHRRELQAALDATQVAREQADRASGFKNNLLAMVSHELRTPITTLQLLHARLRRDREVTHTPKQLQLFDKMEHAAGRLLALVESLLSYAKVESRLSVHLETFSLTDLVEAAAVDGRREAATKHVAFEIERPAALPPLTSDARLVRLVLKNLIGNAVKFTVEGRIDVSVRSEGGVQTVVVRDTGPGIPNAALARIFEPFTHLEPVASKHTPGAGLGLALVREIVDTLHGRLELSSTVGVGSTFRVSFPTLAPIDEGPSHG
jgi:signal transduction histidine kinase